MSVISIRFNSEEENVIKNYAKSKGFSVSQLIKETLMEKIEEEYDLEVCKEYLKAKEEGTLVTIPFEEAIKEWDLE
jgi:conserved domain protein